MEPYAERQNLNIVGGCCGTFPSHIAAMKKPLGNTPPRVPPALEPKMRLSGLESFEQINGTFINVGERCNLLGSRKFKRLIENNQWDDALEILANRWRTARKSWTSTSTPTCSMVLLPWASSCGCA